MHRLLHSTTHRWDWNSPGGESHRPPLGSDRESHVPALFGWWAIPPSSRLSFRDAQDGYLRILHHAKRWCRRNALLRLPSCYELDSKPRISEHSSEDFSGTVSRLDYPWLCQYVSMSYLFGWPDERSRDFGSVSARERSKYRHFKFLHYVRL